jgi:hypothetical protein
MVRQVSPTTTKFAAPLPKLSLLTIFKKLIFMKKKKLLLIALSLMAGSAYMKANDKSGIRIVNGRKLYFKK